MNRKEYKRYSREFKLEAVRLAALGERPKAQIARELGIRVNQLRKWRLEFEAEERAGPPKRPPNLEEDLGHLKRENTRLKEENEILKSGHLLCASRSGASVHRCQSMRPGVASCRTASLEDNTTRRAAGASAPQHQQMLTSDPHNPRRVATHGAPGSMLSWRSRPAAA